MTIGPSMANLVQYYGRRKAYGLSVSPNPLNRNPSYEALINPDRAIRDSELQYVVWDTFSAARSASFSKKLLGYVDRYDGRVVHTRGAAGQDGARGELGQAGHRRLRGAAVSRAALLASILALAGAAPAAAESRPTTPIEHFVVLMQENHSFDNYFGTYPGADGIPDGHLHARREALRGRASGRSGSAGGRSPISVTTAASTGSSTRAGGWTASSGRPRSTARRWTAR